MQCVAGFRGAWMPQGKAVLEPVPDRPRFERLLERIDTGVEAMRTRIERRAGPS